MLWNIRTLNLLAFLVTVVAMATALFYFQGYLGLTACPLCIFQRVGMIGAGAIFLIAGLHKPANTGTRIYALLGLIPTGFGAFIAARHVWIQGLPPDQVPACGPDLAYMMQNFPLQQVINTVLKGSGECADIQWSLLGLTIPGWTLTVFIILMMFQLLQLIKGDFTRKG
ncbi:disulfide bond formation protein B [Gynuella sunshinyii]|uniref:Disulfide bond formation protein B n=1 Tax=Gynuella sunshinyii YC6258 TaxID=1445510 RepID=A0A0C5VWV1_9GAMM|nr:disulfide bond formation protein B [Gynuella sunshinyii]AJQ97748.1 disulfide bond formation protein DsbB [Gynuella sunshinyii YC6258]